MNGIYSKYRKDLLGQDLENIQKNGGPDFTVSLAGDYRNEDEQQCIDPSQHRRLQRYLVGIAQYFYLGGVWNIIDLVSLLLIVATVSRLVLHSATATNTELTAIGTALLSLRVLHYLNGLEATAAYVRMTIAIITDTKAFMLILAILVVGNAFVIMLLYPQKLAADSAAAGSSNGWHLGSTEAQTIEDQFGNVQAALFTSINMLFSGVSLVSSAACIPEPCN